MKKQLALPAESEVTPDSKFSTLGADSLDTVSSISSFLIFLYIHIEYIDMVLH